MFHDYLLMFFQTEVHKNESLSVNSDLPLSDLHIFILFWFCHKIKPISELRIYQAVIGQIDEVESCWEDQEEGEDSVCQLQIVGHCELTCLK